MKRAEDQTCAVGRPDRNCGTVERSSRQLRTPKIPDPDVPLVPDGDARAIGREPRVDVRADWHAERRLTPLPIDPDRRACCQRRSARWQVHERAVGGYV